jgi:enoyl-CoA hydratase/carnithine racemase
MTASNPQGDDRVADRVLLPETLELDWDSDVAVLRLSRERKRNALDTPTVLGLEAFFSNIPKRARAVVLDARGDHFSAGLDLSEMTARDPIAALEHSRTWHRTFERIEYGQVPVISVLKGAVVGGGLELAAATHIRVAEETSFYALPEGQHGLFVGGGGSVRIPKLIGTHRMSEMMLTGRVLSAEDGHQLGISHELIDGGKGFDRALELAHKVAANSPVTNFAVLQALPRIGQSSPEVGFLMESLMSAVAGSNDEAQDRIQAFLDGRGGRVSRR